MMSIKTIYEKLAAILLSASLMTSCGPETLLIVEGGIGGTGISWGTVVAFGSVNVNGVHYDTSNLDKGVWIDGQESSYNQLKVGMVLRVHGSKDSEVEGTARGLEYMSLAKGPANSFNDNQDGSEDFVILGQSIQVTTNTVFDDNHTGGTIIDMATLAMVSDNSLYLEVSGYQGPNNTIYARRVEVKKGWINGDQVRLMGIVTSVNPYTSFDINGQTIYYDSASSSLDGAYVEVEGSYNSSTQYFRAHSVEEEQLGVNGNEKEEFELEGVVTSNNIADNKRFTLNGQVVEINDSTVYEGGIVDDLFVGTEVEAEGRFDANGVLVAEEVEFEEAGNELDGSGSITATTVGNNTITVSGLVLKITNDTLLRDHRDTGYDQFTFQHFETGQNVQYRYYVSNEVNIATRIDIED